MSYLRAVNSSSMVITEPGAGEKISIFGRLMSFERINMSDQASASVIVELRVQEQDKATPVLLKEYRVIEKLNGNTVPDAVAAFDRAVMKIYSDFLSDMQASL